MIKKCCIVFILLGFFSPLDAQIYQSNDSSMVHLSIKVEVLDSQYYIIPQLIIKKKEIKIRIPEKRFYVDGVSVCDPSDSKVYLKKRISNTFASITLGSIKEYIWSKEYPKFICFKYGDILNDTINLQERYPLEPGEYLVILELSYWQGEKKIIVQSPQLLFELFYAPKNARF